MKKFSEQLHKKSTTVKLRAAEKRELRERVVSYMEYHPLPKAIQEAKPAKKLKAASLVTDAYAEVVFPFRKLARWGVGAMAVMLVMVPFWAEQSVPGDRFYAVKVNFNEEVRSTLAFSPQQKIEWETTRLNRRIAEARLLASEDKLTEEAEAQVAKAVQAHTENAKKEIEAIRTEDADAALIAELALDTTLEVQAASLQGVADEALATSTAATAGSLATAIDATRDDAETLTGTSSIPAYDKLMAQVEQDTTRVYELLASESLAQADPEEVLEVERRLSDIERDVETAVDLRSENEAEAKTVLVDVLQRAQRLLVFMTDIQISETIDVEQIVPAILTEEEKIALLESLEQEIDHNIKTLAATVSETEDVALAEKALAAIAQITVMREDIATSTDFVVIRSALQDARELTTDALRMFEINNELIAKPVIDVPEVVTESVATSSATSTEEVAEEDSDETNEESVDSATSTDPVATSSEPVTTPPSDVVEVPTTVDVASSSTAAIDSDE